MGELDHFTLQGKSEQPHSLVALTLVEVVRTQAPPAPDSCLALPAPPTQQLPSKWPVSSPSVKVAFAKLRSTVQCLPVRPKMHRSGRTPSFPDGGEGRRGRGGKGGFDFDQSWALALATAW